MYDQVVPKELLMLKYCLNRNKTQKLCDKAVNDCLSAWNLFLIV